MSRAITRTLTWILIVVVALVAAGVVGIFVGRHFGVTEERSVQVVRSVQGEEQVILLTAGLSEDKTQVENSKFMGMITLPGTSRLTYMRVDFDAKYGIEGKDVTISQTGENAYRITIPEFISLGLSDPQISVATEKNGILSWVTPEVDQNAIIEEVLANDTAEKHIDGFRPMLEDQARQFYTRIVESINPDVTLEFVFAKGSPRD